jgi:hypothetical protein
MLLPPLNVAAPVKFEVPETAKVPPTVSLPLAASEVKEPVEALVLPTGVPFTEPPVMVAPLEAKLFAVVGPFRETAPVPVENVPFPVCEKLPLEVRFVNAPVEAVVAPTGVPFIEPPVMFAFDEAKLSAVTSPVPNVTGSLVTVFMESVPAVALMTGAAAVNAKLPPSDVLPVTVSVAKLGVEITAIVAFVVPEMFIFEPAVSKDASFWNVGAPLPPEVNTWLVLPAALNAYAVPVPYAMAPAVGVAVEFVPPCAMANWPDETCEALIAIGVFDTPVTRPCGSVVNTGTEEAEP